MKPSRLQFVQALSEANKLKRITLCEFVLTQMETNDLLVLKLVFSNDAIFHTKRIVNWHNVRIYTQDLRKTIQHEGDSLKINVSVPF